MNRASYYCSDRLQVLGNSGKHGLKILIFILPKCSHLFVDALTDTVSCVIQKQYFKPMWCGLSMVSKGWQNKVNLLLISDITLTENKMPLALKFHQSNYLLHLLQKLKRPYHNLYLIIYIGIYIYIITWTMNWLSIY